MQMIIEVIEINVFDFAGGAREEGQGWQCWVTDIYGAGKEKGCCKGE